MCLLHAAPKKGPAGFYKFRKEWKDEEIWLSHSYSFSVFDNNFARYQRLLAVYVNFLCGCSNDEDNNQNLVESPKSIQANVLAIRP